MSSWTALDISLAALSVLVAGGVLLTIFRRGRLVGHVAGILGAAGLVIAGLTGMSQPEAQVSFRGVYDFTAITVRMNALAGVFVCLVGVVGLFVAIYGIAYVREYEGRKSIPLLMAGVLFFLACMVSVVLAGNVFTFLASWECMSLISFLLVIFEHERPEIWRAGFVYAAMTHIGTAFLTAAFLILAESTGSFSFHAMVGYPLSDGVRTIVFLFAFIGFATKAGLVPLHVWLPRAHPVAPSHVSALMSGVMIKTAVYGFIMVVFQILSGGPLWWGMLVLLIGAVSALIGVLYALIQADQKRMLAYSSIENMGVIFLSLGISLMLRSLHAPELAAFALLAALVHAFNHGLFKSLLFLGSGAVIAKTHTRNMNLLGGLIRSMPWTAAFSLIAALAIAALPPFNGFVGEWMVFRSAFGLAVFATSAWLRVALVLAIGVLMLTGALVAMTFVQSYGTTFLALPRSPAAEAATEVHLSMRIGMGGLAGLCVGLGIFAKPWVHLLQQVVRFITGVQPSFVAQPLALAGVGAARGPDLTLLITGGGAIVLAWWLLRLFGRVPAVRRSDTWACGEDLTPAMTYTASGYGKPIRLALQRMLRPTRSLEVQGGGRYFPTGFAYASRVQAFAERYLYRPLVHLTMQTARFIRVIQNGQVQSYLAYLFVTLIVVLLLVK